MADKQRLPVVIVLPSAPEELVARYVVSAGYRRKDVDDVLGTSEFDSRGGTYQASIEADDLFQFSVLVKYQVTVDFVADTGLPTYKPDPVELSVADVKKILPLGISQVFDLPNRNPVDFQLAFNYPLTNLPEDFLSIQWQFHIDDQVFRQNAVIIPFQKLPGSDKLNQPIVLCSDRIFHTPDNRTRERLKLTIKGRYRGKPLTAFERDVPVQSLYAFMVSDNGDQPGTLQL